MAIKEDGSLFSWGWNYRGQLGDGQTTTRGVPEQVKGPDGEGLLKDVAQVDGGGAHNVVLRQDGSVLTWGDNGRGQIGNSRVWGGLYKDGRPVDLKEKSAREWSKAGAQKMPGPPCPIVVSLPGIGISELKTLSSVSPLESGPQAPESPGTACVLSVTLIIFSL